MKKSKETVRLILAVLAYSVLSWLLSGLIGLWLPSVFGTDGEWILILYSLLCLAVNAGICVPVFAIIMKAGKDPVPVKIRPEKKLDRRDRFLFLFLALAAGYLSIFAEAFLILGGRMSPASLLPGSGLRLIAAFLSGVLVMPFLEEYMFRGLALNRLRPFGAPFAITVSTLAFAAGHGNPVNILVSLLPGLVIAWAAYKTGGILYSVCLHCLINFMGSFLIPILFAYGGRRAVYPVIGAGVLIYIAAVFFMIDAIRKKR